MPRTWQLQEAKNKLSRVIDDAVLTGPQIITKRGAKTAVILSFDEYRQLVASEKKLSTFFQESPLAGLDLDLERDKSMARDAIQL